MAAAPSDGALRDRLAIVADEPILGRILRSMDDLVAANQVIRQNPDVETGVQTAPFSAILLDARLASIDGCVVDAGVVIELEPGGAERVVSELVETRTGSFTAVRGGDGWRITEFVTDQQFPDVGQCP